MEQQRNGGETAEKQQGNGRNVTSVTNGPARNPPSRNRWMETKSNTFLQRIPSWDSGGKRRRQRIQSTQSGAESRPSKNRRKGCRDRTLKESRL